LDELPEEVIVKILSFLPRQALLTSVPLVSRKLNRLSKDSSLWTHVHFRFNDSPRYIAAVLARFKNSILSVTVFAVETEVPEKIRVLRKSKITFEEVHFITPDDHPHWLDIRQVFQLRSVRNVSFLPLDPSSPSFGPIIPSPRVYDLPKTQLTSLDLSAVYGVDDRMMKAIVKSCPELKLLYIGYRSSYTSVGVRAIADGLPNLTAVSLKGEKGDDDDYRYLLSKKPGLTAVGLRFCYNSRAPLLLTAAQLSRMSDLQHLQVDGFLDAKTVRVMFLNGNFEKLRTLQLHGIDECDREAFKVGTDRFHFVL
jgi:hypothetical protein